MTSFVFAAGVDYEFLGTDFSAIATLREVVNATVMLSR